MKGIEVHDMVYHAKRLAGSVTGVLLLAVSFITGAQADLRLVMAAKDQDWEGMKPLLREPGVNINATQPDGATALAWAAHWNNRDMAQRLLEAGADADIGNDYGVTPLFLAAANGSLDMAATLLESGADLNVSLWSGETPLMTAAQAGQVEMLDLFLKHGADVNARERRRGQTALMWAISFGHPDAARLLIEHGADVTASTTMLEDDFTPMMMPGYMRNVVVTPGGGYTPLMFAARAGDIGTARLLLEHGVDVNDAHPEHGPPLVIAAAAGNEDFALFLLEQGADPNLAPSDGMSALHYALRDGFKFLHDIRITAATAEQDKGSILPGGNMHKLAKALLSRGADPNAAMKYPSPGLRMIPSIPPYFSMTGATPLLFAVAAQDMSALKTLLDAGADPLRGTLIDKEALYMQTQRHDEQNQFQGDATPLMVAVGMGRRNRKFTPEQEQQATVFAKLLVGLGADVNASTSTGWTPLHAAAFIGADSLVTYLVEQGAKLNARNGCGQTPLSLALRANTVGLVAIDFPDDVRESTAELLVTLGADESVSSERSGECILGRPGLDLELELEKQGSI